jgi:TetR/AcrR family transcriptional repressor of nem operon
MARHGFKRGCLVGNLGQEMGTLPESFRAQLQQVFLDWQSRTAACLAEAQRAGEIPPQLDCAALAQFFWIGWEGAVLRAKLDRSPESLDVYAHGFLEWMRIKP